MIDLNHQGWTINLYDGSDSYCWQSQKRIDIGINYNGDLRQIILHEAEKLLPSYQRYWEIERNMDYVGYPGKGDEEEYIKFKNEQFKLEKNVDEFEDEIKRLAQKANEML